MTLVSTVRLDEQIAPKPGQNAYQPFGAALDVLYSREPEVMLSGPAGTGKSRASLEKLHICARKYPKMRGAIARKTRRSITQSAMVTFNRKVLTPDARVTYHHTDHEYRYPNGSVLVIDGLDKNSKLMSTEFDIIYVMEARELTLDDWEALSTRCRWGVMPYQQLIGDTNPDSPAHWIYKRYQEGRLPMLESVHQDNPALFNRKTGQWTEIGKAYIERLARLTGVRRARYLDGLWVQAEGVVYPEFDRLRHWIPPFPIPNYWPRVRVIDFGYVHPFVCHWYALSPYGQLILYRELYGVGRLVSEWAKVIQAYSRGERYIATVTDHDAEGRATLEAALGIQTTPARKAVKTGIEAVKTRLTREVYHGEDKVPALVIFNDALIFIDETLELEKQPTSIIDEFPSYIWEKAADGTYKPDTPVKRYDHGLDTLRYAVMHIDHKEGESIDRIRQKLEDMLND